MHTQKMDKIKFLIVQTFRKWARRVCIQGPIARRSSTKHSFLRCSEITFGEDNELFCSPGGNPFNQLLITSSQLNLPAEFGLCSAQRIYNTFDWTYWLQFCLTQCTSHIFKIPLTQCVPHCLPCTFCFVHAYAKFAHEFLTLFHRPCATCL